MASLAISSNALNDQYAGRLVKRNGAVAVFRRGIDEEDDPDRDFSLILLCLGRLEGSIEFIYRWSDACPVVAFVHEAV